MSEDVTPVPRRRTLRRDFDLELLVRLAEEDLRKRMDGLAMSGDLRAWFQTWAARAWDLGWIGHAEGELSE